MTQRILIYDTEIKKAILGRNEMIQPGIEYCGGWSDHAGMGISVLCAFDMATDTMHTLVPQDSKEDADTLHELISRADYIVGFNSHSFDNKLLAAAGFEVPLAKSYDIYVQVIKAAGLENASFGNRRGYRLDDIAKANGLGGKLTGVAGALAPVLYQQGKLDILHEYCQRDVEMTVAVLEAIIAGTLICPRSRQPLDVLTPKDVLGVVQGGLF